MCFVWDAIDSNGLLQSPDYSLLSDHLRARKRTRWHFSVIPSRPPLSASCAYCRVVTKRLVNRCSSCLKNYGIDLRCATITDKIKCSVIDWPSGEVCDKTASCCLLRPVSESSGRIRSETYSELPLKLIDHFMWSQFWKLCLIQSAKEVATNTHTHTPKHTRPSKELYKRPLQYVCITFCTILYCGRNWCMVFFPTNLIKLLLLSFKTRDNRKFFLIRKMLQIQTYLIEISGLISINKQMKNIIIIIIAHSLFLFFLLSLLCSKDASRLNKQVDLFWVFLNYHYWWAERKDPWDGHVV